MRILFVGDVVGRPGRQALAQVLPRLVEEEGIGLTVANAENAAGGYGITPEVAEELFSLGVDGLTMGNHTFDKKEGLHLLATNRRVVRPVNYPPGTPGQGWMLLPSRDGVEVAVINVHTRLFAAGPLDCPFRGLDQALEAVGEKTRVILVDAHGEATSEKQALARYVDGRVSALVGTHTHVQTADERVLAKGTAYITDVGCTGAEDSVIGMDPEEAVRRFLLPGGGRLQPARGPWVMCGVIVDVDADTGRAREIRRVVRRE